MRRNIGVKAVLEKKGLNEKFNIKKSELRENLAKELTKQIGEFQAKLSEFAVKHRNDISRDPEFREYFQDMCGTIGVDPLASSKGFWSEMLGMGTFYYDIAIQSVEIILAYPINGGIMNLGELQKRLSKSRSQNSSLKDAHVSCKDIKRAFKTLKVFGEGCGIVEAESNKSLADSLVYCVPEELSQDSTIILKIAAESEKPFISIEQLLELGWSQTRAKVSIEKLIREHIIWIDVYSGKETYWFPALFFNTEN